MEREASATCWYAETAWGFPSASRAGACPIAHPTCELRAGEVSSSIYSASRKIPAGPESHEHPQYFPGAFIYTTGASIMERLLQRGGCGLFKVDFRKSTGIDNSLL